jgi:uncharacterized protein (DUF1330 family)
MSAYVIVNVRIHDPIRYPEYMRQVPESLARYGGRFIVRGGRAERLEGTIEPGRVVVLEFDSLELARAWWGSQEYAGPKAIRQNAATTDMILVEGVEKPS